MQRADKFPDLIIQNERSQGMQRSQGNEGIHGRRGNAEGRDKPQRPWVRDAMQYAMGNIPIPRWVKPHKWQAGVCGSRERRISHQVTKSRQFRTRRGPMTALLQGLKTPDQSKKERGPRNKTTSRLLFFFASPSLAISARADRHVSSPRAAPAIFAFAQCRIHVIHSLALGGSMSSSLARNSSFSTSIRSNNSTCGVWRQV